MKIRFWDRVILITGALATMAVGVALFVAGLQIQGTIGDSLTVPARVLCLLFGVLCAAFGGYLLVFPRLYAVHRRDFVVQRTDTGELRIAVKAIENLVKKCIDLHEEIQLNSMSIMNGREGVVVDLNVSLANNISIPLAVASLQKQIKQYLSASSGIEVREVRVSVESTKDEPLLVAEAENAAETDADKKTPIHQRLFCQAEQPANMPAPPKPEEDALKFAYEGADAPAALGQPTHETEEQGHD